MAADLHMQDYPGVREAFLEAERQERVRTGRVASALVVFLMPLGTALEFAVYPKQVWQFLLLRLVCSVLCAGLWFVFTKPFGRNHYRWVSAPVALLPAFFISCMIAVTDGDASPYYAGLNLVILAISVVVRWSFWESVWSVTSIILMYLLACLYHLQRAGETLEGGIIFSNLYFLVLTSVIVVTGNYFLNQLRFREFCLNFEVNENRRTLEEGNRKLSDANAELQQSRQDLGDGNRKLLTANLELHQSRQALEEGNRKLVELNEVKTRFFANISHELRTPLTLLVAPLETLIHQRRELGEEKTQELLSSMHGNALRLLKLINDLLDLVRLEAKTHQVRLEPVRMPEFVQGLASSVRVVAEDKRIQLTASATLEVGPVMTDPDKLEKILLNLLFNAIKFTPGGGRIELRAFCEGPQLICTVCDTGMGISPEHLPHVFDRFWQADTSSKRQYQGVGIGLALVKELAEVLGGSVRAESTLGIGTAMTVTLPYVPATEATLARTVEPEAPSSGAGTLSDLQNQEWLSKLYRRADLCPSLPSVQQMLHPEETSLRGSRPRLLIADDELEMLRFLKSQLSGVFQVLEAVDGQQAIEKAAQFQPDLILCDMMMPEKDGLQVCQELRARSTTATIPILLLTARADEETKLTALKAGASDFLCKPFSMVELHVRLKHLVESHLFQKRLAQQNKALEATLEELKDTEAQLVQSERLAGLGRLSAGLIHEINNPLNYARTGLHLLHRTSEELAPPKRAMFEGILQDVEEGVNRVKNIITDLRTFTHPNQQAYEAVDLNQLTDSALRFMSHELSNGIQVHRAIPDGLQVLGNRNQLLQVLINLCQNSVDSLRGKSFAPEEKPTLWFSGGHAPGKVFLAVRDNGPGIASENLSKVFDPFFTTKEVGQGMGLGLSICYRIMGDHGGEIQVRSEPGRSCEFRLVFPATKADNTAGVTASAQT